MTPRAQWIFGVLILSVGLAIAAFAVLSFMIAPARLSAAEIGQLAESAVAPPSLPAKPAGPALAETKQEQLVVKVPEFKGIEIAFREETIASPRSVERFIEPATAEAKAWETDVDKLAEQRRAAVQAEADKITGRETEKLRDIMANVMQVLAGLLGAFIGVRHLLRSSRNNGQTNDPATADTGTGK